MPSSGGYSSGRSLSSGLSSRSRSLTPLGVADGGFGGGRPVTSIGGDHPGPQRGDEHDQQYPHPQNALGHVVREDRGHSERQIALRDPHPPPQRQVAGHNRSAGRKRCVFFDNGCCKKGDQCPFLHDASSQVTAPPPQQRQVAGDAARHVNQQGRTQRDDAVLDSRDGKKRKMEIVFSEDAAGAADAVAFMKAVTHRQAQLDAQGGFDHASAVVIHEKRRAPDGSSFVASFVEDGVGRRLSQGFDPSFHVERDDQEASTLPCSFEGPESRCPFGDNCKYQHPLRDNDRRLAMPRRFEGGMFQVEDERRRAAVERVIDKATRSLEEMEQQKLQQKMQQEMKREAFQEAVRQRLEDSKPRTLGRARRHMQIDRERELNDNSLSSSSPRPSNVNSSVASSMESVMGRANVRSSSDVASVDILSASAEERESPVGTLVPIPLDESRAKLTRMLKMEAKLKKASPHQRLYLRDVDSMCHGLLPVAHQWCSNQEIETRELVSTSAPEGCVYKFDRKTGQTERLPWQRIDEQIPEDSSARPREVASIIFETHECVEIMSQRRFKPFLDQAKSLDATLLQYRPEMEAVRVGAIALQFIEMVMAACHEGYTHEVMERFTWLPSSDIEAIVAAPQRYSQSSVSLLEGIRKIEPVLTWPPFMSYLHELLKSDSLTAERKAWLRTKLKELPTNEFSTWDWTRRLVGCSEKLVRFVNAVSEEVRANQMQQIVQEILQVLPADVVDAFLETGDLPDSACAKIKDLVSTVDRDSDDYQSYKPATKQALADGGVKVLTEKVANARKSRNPKETLITVEFVLLRAIEEKHPAAFDALFREEGTVARNHHDAGGELASIVVETAHGPHFLVNKSHFVITAEQKTMVHRINSAKSFIATMHLLNRANIVSDAHLEKEKRLIGGFFSTLGGLDGSLSNPKGSFRAARNKISPKGAFLSTVVAGAITTGNQIGKGMGSGETIFARLFLEKDRFRAVLAVFGAHGSSPLENDATCPGVPAVGHLPALLCRSGGTPTGCAGASTKDWSLNRIFTCPSCAEAMRRREKENLRLLQENGHPLGPEQTERLNSSTFTGVGTGGNEDAKEIAGRRSALAGLVDAYAIDPFVGIEDQVEALATDSGLHLDAMKQQLLNCAIAQMWKKRDKTLGHRLVKETMPTLLEELEGVSNEDERDAIAKRVLLERFTELEDTSVASLESVTHTGYTGITSGLRVRCACPYDCFWPRSAYFSFTKQSGADLEATKKQVRTEVAAILLLLRKTLQHHRYMDGRSQLDEDKLGHIEAVKEIVCHVVGRAEEE